MPTKLSPFEELDLVLKILDTKIPADVYPPHLNYGQLRPLLKDSIQLNLLGEMLETLIKDDYIRTQQIERYSLELNGERLSNDYLGYILTHKGRTFLYSGGYAKQHEDDRFTKSAQMSKSFQEKYWWAWPIVTGIFSFFIGKNAGESSTTTIQVYKQPFLNERHILSDTLQTDTSSHSASN